MNDAALVEADGVNLTILGRTILSDVSLSVGSGEIVTLIGPNGAGKSMLARVLLGLVRPDSGRVRRRRGIRVGYMPQRLTVEETLPLDVHRFITLGARADPARVHAALAETGAAHVLHTPVQAISGGELRRVMLARALLREPDLLVLDEPVQAVDFTGQFELYDLIVAIRHRHGCGILMISHELHLVMAATDRVVCLNGHVCCSGNPGNVVKDPAYLDLFGREAVERLAIYSHLHDHRHELHGDVNAPGVEEIDG